jgi:hypothetical protein
VNATVFIVFQECSLFFKIKKYPSTCLSRNLPGFVFSPETLFRYWPATPPSLQLLHSSPSVHNISMVSSSKTAASTERSSSINRKKQQHLQKEAAAASEKRKLNLLALLVQKYKD